MSSSGIDITDGFDFESDKLPFDYQSIDMITLHGVIEHIANPNMLLREIHRIFSIRRVCVIITPNIISEGMTFYDDPDHKKNIFLNRIFLVDENVWLQHLQDWLMDS